MTVLKKIVHFLKVFVVVGVIALAVVVYYSGKTNFRSKVLNAAGTSCLTHIMSTSDGKRDVPPYGDMVFIDNSGCVADSFFKRFKATQVFGGYCKKLVTSWEEDGSAKIYCDKSGSDKGIVLQLFDFENTKINYEIIN